MDSARQRSISLLLPSGANLYTQSSQAVSNSLDRLCRRFYQGRLGRPRITPGDYFRSLLLGYVEGIDSERGMGWRLGDSLPLRRFIGYALTEETPDHSTVPRTLRLYTVKRIEPYSGGCCRSWLRKVRLRARRFPLTRPCWKPMRHYDPWCGGIMVRNMTST